jgi:hypothetical protein
MLLSSDRKTLGSLASGPVLLGIGWLATALLVALSVILVVTTLVAG